MRPGFTVEAFTSLHRRTSFASGSEPLDRYLKDLATQDIKRRLSNCFVLLDDEGRLPASTPWRRPACR